MSPLVDCSMRMTTKTIQQQNITVIVLMMIKKYTTGEIDAPSVILIKNNNSRHNVKQKTNKKYICLHESEGKATKILLQQSVSSMVKKEIGFFKTRRTHCSLVIFPQEKAHSNP